jgi:peptide/nickel transport system substrate-binding protein
MSSLMSAGRRRTTVAAAVGLGAALGVSACSTTSAGGSSATTGSSRAFTVNWGTSISSLDPAFVCPGDDNSFASNFYGRLVKLSETETSPGVFTANPDPSKVQPDFATGWKVSDDGKTYTFTLPADKKFANGDPLDAAAVKYSIDRTLKIGACGALSLQLGITNPGLVTGVEAPDATTVVLTLSQPYPAILYSLAQSRGSIYDPKVIEANGGVQASQPNKFLTSNTASSSGPYVLAEYVPNNHAVLKRNPNYYGTAALEPEIRVNFIPSVPTLLLQAQNKQADVTLGLPPQSVNTLSTNACCRVVTADSTTPVTVSMNQQGPVTNNQKLREALTYAIPYDQILKQVAFGYGDLYYGPVVPGMAGYNAALEPARTYDVAKAKSLIAESGVASPAISLMINPTAPGVSEIATILQSAWQAVGVQVTLDAKPPADFSTLFNGGKYQSALLFENSTPIGGYELRKKMTCGSSFNNQHICLDGSTPLLQKLDQTADVEKQQPLVDELTKLWVANSPTIILYRAKFTAVVSPSVKRFAYAASYRFSEWSR